MSLQDKLMASPVGRLPLRLGPSPLGISGVWPKSQQLPALVHRHQGNRWPRKIQAVLQFLDNSCHPWRRVECLKPVPNMIRQKMIACTLNFISKLVIHRSEIDKITVYDHLKLSLINMRPLAAGRPIVPASILQTSRTEIVVESAQARVAIRRVDKPACDQLGHDRPELVGPSTAAVLLAAASLSAFRPSRTNARRGQGEANKRPADCVSNLGMVPRGGATKTTIFNSLSCLTFAKRPLNPNQYFRDCPTDIPTLGRAAPPRQSETPQPASEAFGRKRIV
jgi:hypothetical protein